jgi:SnoaL-like protein
METWPGRTSLEPQLLIEELDGRSWSTKDSVERSRWHDAERRRAMSSSIATLLTRNLHDVFGENDPARRRAAIDELFTEDGVFYDPSGGVYRGRDAIDRVAGTLRATHPDFRYQPIAGPEEVGDGGRIQWVEGRPGEAPAHAGTDFIIARDGRIAAVYLFFDELP